MGGSAKNRRKALVATPVTKGAKQAVAKELAAVRREIKSGKVTARVARDLRYGEDPLTAISKTRKGAKVAAGKPKRAARIKGQTKTG